MDLNWEVINAEGNNLRAEVGNIEDGLKDIDIKGVLEWISKPNYALAIMGASYYIERIDENDLEYIKPSKVSLYDYYNSYYEITIRSCLTKDEEARLFTNSLVEAVEHAVDKSSLPLKTYLTDSSVQYFFDCILSTVESSSYLKFNKKTKELEIWVYDLY